MSRPAGATEPQRNTGFLDIGAVMIAIQFPCNRHEQHINTSRHAQLLVTIPVARVIIDILAGQELCRIDKDTYHQQIALITTLFDQRKMALM